MNIFDLIEHGESKTLEFKEQLPNNDSIAKTVIGFSNTSGGKLIIGVNDSREIIGIDSENLFDLQDKIASIVFDRCYPNILPEIYTLNHEGKLLLVIEVFRGNLLPYYLKSEGKNNGTYIRLGATNRKASFENIIELERQKRYLGYDEEVCYDVEFKTIDLLPLLRRFDQVGKKLDEGKLKNLKLIKEENTIIYPTNALMIVLGLFDHCSIKCARFKGVTMELFIDKKEYGGDIFSVLENAQNFILNHINLRGEIKGLYRTDTYEIPVVALREALINALIHRDYINGGRDIKVGIYDDIVNIVSPGSFPNTITSEDIASGRSEARNKVVANIFKELGLIEQWGSGINRIKTMCIEAGLKEARIEEKNDFVDVVFFRPIGEMSGNGTATTKVSESITKVSESISYLTEQEKAILKYLKLNDTITSKQVESLIDLKEARARRLLKQMTEKHLIAKLGSGRSTYYVIAAAF